jgi:glycosyltransferase involved in cell wall biosynthesis
VVLLCYEQHWTTRLALMALGAQRFDGAWEVIVTDDGSMGRTVPALLTLLEDLPVAARYVWQQSCGNREQRARNNAIKIARGRSLLFLDGDMVPSQDLVAAHAAEQARSPALVAGARRWVHQDTDLADVPEPSPAALERLAALERSADSETRQRDEREAEIRERLLASHYSWRVCYACNLSVPWSPDLWFDEGLEGWGPSDMDLAARLVERHGYAIRYRRDLIAWHVYTEELSFNVFRRGRHEEIARYLQSMLTFLDRYPDPKLEAEETADWVRFTLDDQDRWSLVPWQQARDPSRDPREVVIAARQWVARNARSPRP